jgi:hypothetical protein
MFSNNWFLSKNGAKREIYSDNSISHRTNYSGLSHNKTAPKGMETTLIIKIATWIGITSYIGAIILNAGTWKADTLWFLALMFGVVRFIRYSVKTWQDFRRGELEIKIKRKESEK